MLRQEAMTAYIFVAPALLLIAAITFLVIAGAFAAAVWYMIGGAL